MTEGDRFWLLVSRKLANEATRAQLNELDHLIAAHPDLKVKFEALCDYWPHAGRKQDVDVNAAFQKTLHALQAKENLSVSRSIIKVKPNAKLLWVGMVACFVILILLIASLRFSSFLQPLPASTDIVKKHNEKGMRSEILLSDGSTVWLNADSEIHYPEVFTAHSREIHLSGEAYFDIVPNPARPFIIHLENNQIRVLGTSFNVKAYKEDDVIETAVVSGEVAFIRTGANATKDQKDTLLLTSNYKVLYSKQTGMFTKTSTDARMDTAWKDGKLIFRSARFSEVGKILERTFGKEVILSEPALGRCRLTATFQNNSLEEIMILISKTNNYTYEITEKQLKISGPGCP